MKAHPQTVSEAIASHRQMVAIDEACFDEDGVALNEGAAEDALADEVSAFRAFCAIPCLDDQDVQAKVDYVLNGTVGQRTPLMECLFEEEYGGSENQAMFLRSLHTVEAK